MQKILFTNHIDVTFETEKINKMFQTGLDILHIRKDKYSLEQLKFFISKIDSIYHSKIVIHDHFDLLNIFNLKGIHISREKRKSIWFNFFTLKRIKNKFPSISISYSADSISQLKRIIKKEASYIFIGKIFSSNTSNRLSFQYKKETLIDLNHKTKIPLIALGGVDDITTYKAMQMDFAGIALQSYIWNSIQPVDSFNYINNIINGTELIQIAKHA